MIKYRNYTDQDIIENAKKVKSLAALLKSLNLKQAGGNYANMRRLLQKLNVDCSHWTGQGWNKNIQMKDWSDYTKAGNCKKHLIKERGNQCEQCKLKKWLEQKIKLEIHHKDGNRTNNSFENLQLLCPNCHSYTPNFRNRKRLVPTVEFESTL